MSTQTTSGCCPNCGSGEISKGRLLDVIGIGGRIVFRPKGRGCLGWLFRKDANLTNPTFACSNCGLLWTFVDATRLK